MSRRRQGRGREGRLGSLIPSSDIAPFRFVPSHTCKKTYSLSDSRLQDPKNIATPSRLTKTAKIPTPTPPSESRRKMASRKSYILHVCLRASNTLNSFSFMGYIPAVENQVHRKKPETVDMTKTVSSKHHASFKVRSLDHVSQE
jgi:hypothetical protein